MLNKKAFFILLLFITIQVGACHSDWFYETSQNNQQYSRESSEFELARSDKQQLKAEVEALKAIGDDRKQRLAQTKHEIKDIGLLHNQMQTLIVELQQNTKNFSQQDLEALKHTIENLQKEIIQKLHE